MRTCVPTLVGVNVQVTTLIVPIVPQLYESREFGSIARTSQFMTPSQPGTGVERKLNRWPTTGWKSFFISHSSISAPCVSARQTFSGRCGTSRSITRVRVGAVLVIGPSFSVGFRVHQIARARRRHRRSSSPLTEPELSDAHYSESHAPRADRAPTWHSSECPDASTRPAATPRHDPSTHVRSVPRREIDARRSLDGSGRRGP